MRFDALPDGKDVQPNALPHGFMLPMLIKISRTAVIQRHGGLGAENLRKPGVVHIEVWMGATQLWGWPGWADGGMTASEPTRLGSSHS